MRVPARMEIQRHSVVPLLARTQAVEGARAASIVDEDVEAAEGTSTSSLIRAAASRSVISWTITSGRSRPKLRRPVSCHISQAFFSRATIASRHPSLASIFSYRAPESDAGTGDKRDLAGKLKVHGTSLSSLTIVRQPVTEAQIGLS